MLGPVESEMVRLISRQIIFAHFQPITIPQRYRQTDRQLALAIPLSAKLRAVMKPRNVLR